jgi:hypothetical protein
MERLASSDPEVLALLKRVEQARKQSLLQLEASKTAIEASRSTREHLKRLRTAHPEDE